MHWLESESSDGAVQVTEVIHLEYIKLLPQFVVLVVEDAFDCVTAYLKFARNFLLETTIGNRKSVLTAAGC